MMIRFRPALALGSLLASAAFSSRPALAHINLLEPAARVPGRPDSTLRLGPCGQRQNERIDARVSVLRPGQTFDVVWEVYVQHASYFRISFDPDGDDSFSTRPSAPSDPSADDPTELVPGDGEIILDYVLDRAGDVERVERSVVLPELECDRCTLQLTQFSYGLPLDESFYYQCADVVLDAGDGVIEAAADVGPALGASDPEAADEGAGCSLARAPRSSSGSEGSSRWRVLPLFGWLTLGVRRSRRTAAHGNVRS